MKQEEHKREQLHQNHIMLNRKRFLNNLKTYPASVTDFRQYKEQVC